MSEMPPQPDWGGLPTKNVVYWNTERQTWLYTWSGTYAADPVDKQLYRTARPEELEHIIGRWVKIKWGIVLKQSWLFEGLGV